MATVYFDQATRVYPGSETPAVDKLSLEVKDGEFLVLVGPSGCGKSTSLRMLAGLEEVTSGRILIDDEDVTDVLPKNRDIAMVFQNYALYPHMTVAQNMGFALKIAKFSKKEIDERVNEAAEILDLTQYLDRKPKALSGGQRQRVAMGRAIVRKPKVFLMDEPLSNLDAKLRVQTRSQIASLQRRLGVTTIYVTHDQTEALTMGDRIAIMKDGVLHQVASPQEMYDKPANVFVGGFIGSPAMNIGVFPVVQDKAQIGATQIHIPEEIKDKIVGPTISLGVRPDAFKVVSPTTPSAMQMKVVFIEHLGSDNYVYGQLVNLPAGAQGFVSGESAANMVVRVDRTTPIQIGETVGIVVNPQSVHYFNAENGERL